MNNKQFYKETFDAIQMSEESIRKVKNMSENRTKKRRLKTGFRAAIAAASLVAVFAIGNVAVYAATGSSLVEKVAEKVSVYINDEKVDVDRITKGTDENGNDYYQIKLDEDKDEIHITESMSEELESTYHVETANDNFKTRLLKEGKKIYLLIDGGEKGIEEMVLDITKDFEDGKAEGSFVYNGYPYLYKVSGTVEKYNINIENLPAGYTEKPSRK